ncbi:MAG TPA: TolC family protein [Bryobacteraceae bacterium]|jgi:outer membrane protein TolC
MKLLRTPIPILASLALAALQAYGQFPPPASQRPEVPSGGIHFSDSGQFNGSVATGTASSTPLKLTLQDAIDRALKTNLGMLVRGTETSAARADRLRTLSALLPNVTAAVAENETQISLAVYGLRFPGIPSVVGPFSYTDARAFANVPVFDWTAFKNLKAAVENARAAQLSVEDGRDLVAQSVAAGYVTILADAGRIDVTRTQIATADALAVLAHDRHQAGILPAIDDLRAQVELKTQQQRLLILQNQLAKDKLVLARAIGLPSGQDFDTADEAPYRPIENLDPANLLSKAYEARADYRSGEAQLHAAEIARQASNAQRLPTGNLSANYGDIGPSLAQSHGTFTVTGTVSINVFDGGRIRSDQASADAEIERRRNDLADLRGKIDFEVRTALLDLNTAANQVSLARDNLDLANQTLTQARDRVAAGVTDNLEAVQAQEAVAAANQDLINGMYMHNLAKVSLARAVGSTETSLKQFLGSGSSAAPGASNNPAVTGGK